MLTLPDLNRLKVFYVVYSNRSILKASQILNVTRSAVSQNLKALEDELHATLFIRDSKKVQATSTADILYGVMHPFLQELESAVQQIETGRKTPVGHIRIGAPFDFGSDHLTEAIAKFKRKYPLISLEIFLGVPVRQLDLLSVGKLDLAFIDNGDVFGKTYPISIEPIMKEDFVLVASNDFYEENVSHDHSFSKLKALPIVDYLPYAPVARMWFKHHFGKNLTVLKATYSAESVRAVLKAISLGMGIGVIPSRLIQDQSKKDLKVIRTKKPELVNQITIAQILDHKPSLAEKTFVEFCRNAL